jgi:hypothetical protein
MVGGIDEVTTSMVDWDRGARESGRIRRIADGRMWGWVHAGPRTGRGCCITCPEASHRWFSWSEAMWAAANNRLAFWMTLSRCARGLEGEQMGGTPYNENAVTEASEEPTSRAKDGRHSRGQECGAIGSDPEDLLGDGSGCRVVVRFGTPWPTQRSPVAGCRSLEW